MRVSIPWKALIVAGILAGGSLVGLLSQTSHSLVLQNAKASVYFSPRGGAQDAVVAAVDSAQASVLVQAYSFTSPPIAAALKRAHDRGVQVFVILDKSQRTEKYSGLTFLQHAGISVWVDSQHSIAHSKVMVIDAALVITGSFNFTLAGENKNAENLLVIQDAQLAKVYRENWELHQHHSEGP